jgi:glycerol-3-phosphate dehydrogenase
MPSISRRQRSTEVERIVIIGGGGTGAALAHDLTLRGFEVVVVEKGSLLSGTSGRHHGLLHSGARYVLHDIETARECYIENLTLRRLAPQAIEANDGLFVALNDRDMDLYSTFIERCAKAGIPTRSLSAEEARTLEPGLTQSAKAAVQVPDAAMDAWRLPLHFFATAHANGATIRPFTRVDDLIVKNSCVSGVRISDIRSDAAGTIPADLVVNAAGPWAGRITAMAGLENPVQPGPGVMVSVKGRLTNMILNRLHAAGEGDILVPQRNLTVIGSTAWLARDPDRIKLPVDHVQRLFRLGARLLPALAEMQAHAAWCACRPLVRPKAIDAPMRISRGFACIDHHQTAGLEGLVSVIGGKATTLRAMAEETTDLICAKTGRTIVCTTASSGLVPYRRLMQSSNDWI